MTFIICQVLATKTPLNGLLETRSGDRYKGNDMQLAQRNFERFHGGPSRSPAPATAQLFAPPVL